MKKYVKFEVMDEDRICQVVTVSNGKARVECIEPNFIYHLVAKDCATEEDVRMALGRRMIGRNDPNIQEMLRLIGLKEYDEFEIARLTHCFSYNDDRWVRFEGENIDYQGMLKIGEDL